MISQDFDEIYITVAEFDDAYIEYITHDTRGPSPEHTPTRAPTPTLGSSARQRPPPPPYPQLAGNPAPSNQQTALPVRQRLDPADNSRYHLRQPQAQMQPPAQMQPQSSSHGGLRSLFGADKEKKETKESDRKRKEEEKGKGKGKGKASLGASTPSKPMGRASDDVFTTPAGARTASTPGAPDVFRGSRGPAHMQLQPWRSGEQGVF